MTVFDVPEFPPLLTGHAVLPPSLPHLVAREARSIEELEPGQIFWLQSHKDIKLAFYLEPEVPYLKAVQIIPTLMVAFADSMGAIAPPEFAVHFSWPNIIYANKAKVGNINLTTPRSIRPDDIPDWLILGIDIALENTQDECEPGEIPHITTLSDEGCGHLSSVEIIESLSRHFLTWIHIWEEDGFNPVHRAWLYRAFNLNQNLCYVKNGLNHEGIFTGLDEDGGQLLKTDKGTVCLPLHNAF